MTPRVSVLIPVHDEEPYLADALAAVSAQTLADFEAIVVDDGSTDGSLALARAHAREDRRFRVVRQAHGGLAAALERARIEARGEVLAVAEGDDVSLPERLALQVATLDEEGLAACGGRVAYFPEETLTDGLRRYESWLNGLVTVEAAARDVFVECPLPHAALVARADAVAAAGGYRSAGWPDDYDLVLRLWAGGGRFRNVDELVLRWRDHPGRHSRTSADFELDAFVRCKVHHLRATLVAGRAAVVWGAGPVGKSFARELRRQGTEVAAFVEVDPRKLGKTIHGAPVVPVEEAGRFEGTVALGAVAGPKGREQVRRLAAAAGRREGVDFVAVA